MTRPAIGCTRISTHGQRDGYGQADQAAEITRYAETHGYDLLEVVPEVESGARELAGRDAVQRYYQLADATPGLTFIFPRVDRIGRRAELILGIVRELHARRANVVILGFPMDLRTREGLLMLTTLAGMAEFDYGGIRDRMEAGRRAKAQAGRWPHGTPPWGYQLARDARGVATLPEIIEDRAAAVRRAFELALEHGEAEIVRTMRAEGWPAPTSSGWVRKTVANVVTNPLYAGRRVYQGVTIEYPAVIEPDLMARVQTARERRRIHGGPKGAQPLLWSGHARCTCGAAIGRDQAQTTTQGERVRYPVYRCWRRNKARLTGQVEGTHAREIKAEWADQRWWDALTALLVNADALREIARPTHVAPPLPPERVEALEAAIARAYEPLTAGAAGYTLAIAERLAQPYADELARLRADHAAQAGNPEPDADALAAQFQDWLAEHRTWEERRELLRTLNVQVQIGPDGVAGFQVELP